MHRRVDKDGFRESSLLGGIARALAPEMLKGTHVDECLRQAYETDSIGPCGFGTSQKDAGKFYSVMQNLHVICAA
jgi:hypothetical protein